MKKLTLLFTVLAFAFINAGTLFAQSADLDASVEVLQQLSLDAHTEVNFGSVDPDLSANTPTIPTTSTDAKSGIVDETNAIAGLISVNGAGDQTIDVSGFASITLTQVSGNETITFTPAYNYSAENTAASSSEYTAVNGSDYGSTFSFTLDSDGESTIIVGGELSGSATQAAGTYEGSGSITVSYQ